MLRLLYSSFVQRKKPLYPISSSLESSLQATNRPSPPSSSSEVPRDSNTSFQIQPLESQPQFHPFSETGTPMAPRCVGPTEASDMILRSTEENLKHILEENSRHLQEALKHKKQMEDLTRSEQMLTKQNERLTNEAERLTKEIERHIKEKERQAKENEQLIKENEQLIKENKQLIKEKGDLLLDNMFQNLDSSPNSFGLSAQPLELMQQSMGNLTHPNDYPFTRFPTDSAIGNSIPTERSFPSSSRHPC